MKTAVKSPESSDYRCGLRLFLTETPLTAAPKHLFGPLFPRNPHFPALWSDPMAVSKTSRRKQIPCSQSSLYRFPRIFLELALIWQTIWIDLL